MVRLKDQQDAPKIRGYISFNSTMVRLKAGIVIVFSTLYIGFNSTMVRLKDFTFANPSSVLICFNSTMVRLKVSESPHRYGCHRCFNSTMVRLKGLPSLCCPAVSSSFQFHYGTIKSQVPGCSSALRWCFNSTMVRLKVVGKLERFSSY